RPTPTPHPPTTTSTSRPPRRQPPSRPRGWPLCRRRSTPGRRRASGVFLGGRVRDDVGLLRRVEHLGIVAVRAGNELAVGADPELTAAPVERPRRVVGHLGRARGIQAAVVPHHSYFGA